MSPSQAKAVAKYRDRLADKGLARFEVLGRKADRMLIRSLARTIAEDDEKAAALREFAEKIIEQDPPKRGSILAAFRRSPWVGAELDLTRSTDDFRTVEF
jgi:transposase